MLYDNGLNQVLGPLQSIWGASAAFIPQLLTALVIFVVGLIIATGLGALVQKVLDIVKLDGALKTLGLEPYFERAGLRLNASWFLGQVVFWFLAISFLIAAADILQLPTFSAFLRDVLNFIPSIVIAVLIMLASVVVANFLRGTVKASVQSAKLPASHFLGSLVWWTVILFGFLAMLSQLNIAPSIVNSIVTGFIAMLALAGGLAFGLGGKEYAGYLVSKLRDHTGSR